MHFKGDNKLRLLLQQSTPKCFPQHFPAAAALLPLSAAGASSSFILPSLAGSSPLFYLRAKDVGEVKRENLSHV